MMSHLKFLFSVGNYVSNLEHYLLCCLQAFFCSVIIELNFPSSLPIRSKCPFRASLLGH